MNPNLAEILSKLWYLVENTSVCQYVSAALMIAVIGYGWRTLWRGIKVAGDVLSHLRAKDWGVE